MKERNRFSDFIRGIAVLLMIQVHINELIALPDISQMWTGKLSLFLGSLPAAPLFLAIMGYYVAAGTKTPMQIFLRGIRLFVGGILLNIGLNFLFLVEIFSGQIVADPWAYIFGADILPLAGLSLIAIAGLKRILEKHFLIAFVLSLLVVILNYLPTVQWEYNSLEGYVFAFLFSEDYWSYFPLIPWFSYPLLGFAFRRIEITPFFRNWFNDNIHKIFIVSATVSLGLLYFFFPTAITLEEYYHFTLPFYLWSLFFLSFWLLLFHYIWKPLSHFSFIKLVEYFGKEVTVIYVIQWLIIGNFGNEYYQSFNHYKCLLTFCIVLLLSYVLSRLYLKARMHYSPQNML